MRKSEGFTLIELCIVVAVIGLLAAIAIPDFMKFMAKAKQSEAKVLLGAIAASEMQHKLQTGVFAACPVNPPEPGNKWKPQVPEWLDLGFGIAGEPLFYRYSVVADATGFVAYAKGNLDADTTLDEWEISSKYLSPKNNVNDVQN